MFPSVAPILSRKIWRPPELSCGGHVVSPDSPPFWKKRETEVSRGNKYGKKTGRFGAPVLPESMFPLSFYLSHSLHGLYRCLYQVAVVTNRYVSSFLEVDSRVLRFCSVSMRAEDGPKTHDNHFLARCLSERLCPSDLTRVAFHPAIVELRLLRIYGIESYLKFLWHLKVNQSARRVYRREGSAHLDVQNRKTFASFLTNADPKWEQRTQSINSFKLPESLPCPG